MNGYTNHFRFIIFDSTYATILMLIIILNFIYSYYFLVLETMVAVGM